MIDTEKYYDEFRRNEINEMEDAACPSWWHAVTEAIKTGGMIPNEAYVYMPSEMLDQLIADGWTYASDHNYFSTEMKKVISDWES